MGLGTVLGEETFADQRAAGEIVEELAAAIGTLLQGFAELGVLLDRAGAVDSIRRLPGHDVQEQVVHESEGGISDGVVDVDIESRRGVSAGERR